MNDRNPEGPAEYDSEYPEDWSPGEPPLPLEEDLGPADPDDARADDSWPSGDEPDDLDWSSSWAVGPEIGPDQLAAHPGVVGFAWPFPPYSEN